LAEAEIYGIVFFMTEETILAADASEKRGRNALTAASHTTGQASWAAGDFFVFFRP
jgi:hypothetical protein